MLPENDFRGLFFGSTPNLPVAASNCLLLRKLRLNAKETEAGTLSLSLVRRKTSGQRCLRMLSFVLADLSNAASRPTLEQS